MYFCEGAVDASGDVYPGMEAGLSEAAIAVVKEALAGIEDMG